MVRIEEVPNLPFPLRFVCHGPHGCGTPLVEEDIAMHAAFHARQGDPLPLPEYGANDVPPMPPRAGE
jgi:hypothetical protein